MKTRKLLSAAGIAVLAAIYLPAEKLFAQSAVAEPLQLALNGGGSGDTLLPSWRDLVHPVSLPTNQPMPFALQFLTNTAGGAALPEGATVIAADPPASCISTQTVDPSGTKISLTEGKLIESQSIESIGGTTGSSCDCGDSQSDSQSVSTDISVSGPNLTYTSGLAQVNTVAGYGWTFLYNEIVAVQFDGNGVGNYFWIDPNGRVIKFTLSAGSLTPPAGVSATLQEKTRASVELTDKNLTKSLFQVIPNTHFSLDGGAVYRLTNVVDRNGDSLTLAYSDGDLISVTDTYGRKVTFTYDANHHIASVTNPLGQTTTLTYALTYDMPGTDLIRITDPSGKEVTYTYKDHLLTSKKDRDNRLFLYEWTGNKATGSIDGSGGVIFRQSNPGNWAIDPVALANDQMLVYLPSTTTKTDGRGNVWLCDYDSHGYITKMTAPDDTVNRMTAPDSAVTQYTYDAGTLMIKSVTDANNHTTQYEYDSKRNRTKITLAAPFNYVTTFTYEAVFNMMTSMTDPKGRVTAYTYDGHGNRMLETDPLLQTRHWTYDTHGKVLTETDKRGNTTTYHYDANGNRDRITAPPPLGYITRMTSDIVDNLKSRTDPSHHTTLYDYDSFNRLIMETDPAGKITETSYDGQGNRTKVIDRNNHSTMFEYDGRQRLIKTTDALGQTTTSTYDGNNNLISMTDKNGHTTAFDYDVQNRLSGTRDAEGNVSTLTYDPVGNLTSSTDANLHTTAYTYDELNRRSTVTNALGYVTRFEYDMGGSGCGACGATPGSSLVTKQTDGNGKVTYYRYDALDRLTTTVAKEGDTADVIDASDAVTSYTYDANNNRLSTIEPNGNSTAHDYDVLNRHTNTNEVNAAGDVTHFTYDGVSNLITMIAPNGNVTTNTYDNLDRMIQVDDSIGRVANYTYDNAGNRLSQADGNSNLTQYTYDAINRSTIVTDPLTRTTVTQYDPVGNVLTVTDREGHITTNIYDNINRRISNTDALGHTTRYQYDGVGNVLKVTDANGHATQYLYDGINRVKMETYADPPPNTRTFAYDAVNLISRTDQEHQTTVYTYNDLYFLMKRAYPVSPADKFSYDLSGRMLTAERGGWVVTFTYDGANRVTQTRQNGKIISYAYDIPGRTRIVTYPGGRSITEQMDFRSRLSTIDDAASPSPIVQYTYDLGNRVGTRAYRNGTLATFSYNANDWILSLEHTLGVTRIAGFGYDFDKEGNKKFEEKRHNTTRSEGYQYDNIYRLIDYKVGALVGSSVSVPITQTQYNLDPVHNWSSKTTDGVTQTRRHDEANELTRIDATNLTYDDNGNLMQDSAYTYSYDEENRLTGVTRNSDAAIVGQYQYDALSRRVEETANPAGVPGTTRYIYDGARIIEEQDTLDVTRATYTYGNYIDEVLTMDRGAQTFYYHQNSLWSAEAITNAAGATTERYAYDAYGQAAVFDGTGAAVAPNAWGTPHSAIGNPWMFTGRQFAEETGLYYYRARYHDPVKGRFLQRDPLGYVDGMNLSGYVNDSPLMNVDPYGLFDSKYHRSTTTAGLSGTGLSPACVKTIADADVAQDNGWLYNGGPFADPANHGDNGPPGITAAINRIVQRWYTIEGIKKCTCCRDIDSMLKEFGKILHGVQDLYSHSDYVNKMDAVALGTSTVGSLPLWPMFGQPGNTPNIPAGVTSGNYKWPFDNGTPPTHAQMDKDNPNKPASKVKNLVGTSAFALAIDLATRHTTALWNALSAQMSGNPCWKKLLQCCNQKGK